MIYKRSDKGKRLVVMPKETYIAKAKSVVDEYKPVGKNPTPKLQAQTKRIIHDTMDTVLDEKIVKILLPHASRTAEFYGLPKTHKDNIPLRPIVSAYDDPLDKLTWFLERIVTQLLAFVPAHLKNTEQYLSTLKNKYPDGLPPGTIVFTMDVNNLYGNIPTDEAIDAVCSMIQTHEDKIDLFGLPLDAFKTLLRHCLHNNFVSSVTNTINKRKE